MYKKRPGLIFVGGVVLGFATNAAAVERQGWYAGLDLGVAIPETLDARARDSDVRSNCDQWLRDGDMSFPLRPDDSRCQERGANWTNRFDFDGGILAGLNLGYAWRSFRFEVEYLHRRNSGEKSVGEQSASDLGGQIFEFAEASEMLSNLRADSFFVNLYYDFHGLWSRVIPYVGVAAGVTKTRLDISGKYLRNTSRAFFTDHDPPKNPELAGTETLYDDELSDTAFSYQFMAGFDYALTDQLFLGVKARYADVGADFSERNPYDRLRSHASTVCPPNGPEGCPAGAANDVHYWFATDDLSFWGISLNLKYFFQ